MRKKRVLLLGLRVLLLGCIGFALYVLTGRISDPTSFPGRNPRQELRGPADIKAPTQTSVASLERPIFEYEFRVGEKVNAIAFSPDGLLLAVAPDGKELMLWDVGRHKEVRTFVDSFAHGQRVTSLAFSTSGQVLASAEDIFRNDRLGGNDIKFWEVSSGTLQGNIVVNRAAFNVAQWPVIPDADATVYMNSIAFHPNTKTLLASINVTSRSGATQGEIREWDVTTGTLKRIRPHELRIESTALSPDGTTLAIGCNGEIEMWDVETAQLRRTLHGSPSYGHAGTLSFSPDGRVIASGNGPQPVMFIGPPIGMVDQLQSVHFWNVNGTFLNRLSDTRRAVVTAIAFSPDGVHLAVGTSAAFVSLYRIK